MEDLMQARKTASNLVAQTAEQTTNLVPLFQGDSLFDGVHASDRFAFLQKRNSLGKTLDDRPSLAEDHQHGGLRQLGRRTGDSISGRRNRAMLYAMWDCGLRVGEVVGLSP